MFRDILVAVDQSETAQRALVVAGELAESINARLTLIAVSPEVPTYAHRAEIDVHALEHEVERETAKLIRDSVDALPEGLPVTTMLKHGHPGERIVEQLEQGGHDLLVMGSRARGRVASNLFGSTAAYVHFHFNVAMLVIHPEEHPDG